MLSPKIASVFVHVLRISHNRAYVLQFFAKHLTPTMFNFQADFVITGGSFKF